jgi:hypothetical protein
LPEKNMWLLAKDQARAWVHPQWKGALGGFWKRVALPIFQLMYLFREIIVYATLSISICFWGTCWKDDFDLCLIGNC